MRSVSTQLSVQIAAQLLEQDGTYTLHGNPVQFGGGYQVGGLAKEAKNLTLNQAAAWVREQIATFDEARQKYFLGSWTDKQGNVYLDVTDHHDNLGRARTVGDIRGEVAIWDWAYNTSVTVG